MVSPVSVSANDENKLEARTLFSSVCNLSVTASYYLLLYTTLTDNNKNWFCYSDSLSSLDCMHDFASAGLDRFPTARKSSTLFSPLELICQFSNEIMFKLEPHLTATIPCRCTRISCVAAASYPAPATVPLPPADRRTEEKGLG